MNDETTGGVTTTESPEAATPDAKANGTPAQNKKSPRPGGSVKSPKKAASATKAKTGPVAKARPATAPKADGDAAGQFGIERAKDVPWSEKKVTVFRTLKRLGAVGASAARATSEVAEKAGLSARDVRHYCYHAKAAGLVGVAVVEGTAGYGFYLTARGAAVDPAKALKDRQAAKAGK